jgi:hypothetical protein
MTQALSFGYPSTLRGQEQAYLDGIKYTTDISDNLKNVKVWYFDHKRLPDLDTWEGRPQGLSMTEFLIRYEHRMIRSGILPDLWSHYLSPYLDGYTREIYAEAEQAAPSDYTYLRAKLLSRLAGGIETFQDVLDALAGIIYNPQLGMGSIIGDIRSYERMLLALATPTTSDEDVDIILKAAVTRSLSRSHTDLYVATQEHPTWLHLSLNQQFVWLLRKETLMEEDRLLSPQQGQDQPGHSGQYQQGAQYEHQPRMATNPRYTICQSCVTPDHMEIDCPRTIRRPNVGPSPLGRGVRRPASTAPPNFGLSLSGHHT